MTISIQFLGATETVTGSKYLLCRNNNKILVDCGLFQGHKSLRLRNWNKLPIEASQIDAVVLTHAHIDHTGYLPLLVKNGFKGPIYATEGTYDLSSILLPDCAHLQEEDTRYANHYGYTKHQPALPLYTVEDANLALQQFKTVQFGKPYTILSDIQITWSRAGHILGAAVVQFDIDRKKIVFTGDLGRPNDPIMNPPATIQHADYLITESTYGNRLHHKNAPTHTIGKLIQETAHHGGTVLIPAFAVGRSQNIIYYLHQLKKENSIPNIPIYLDSPLAIKATDIFCKHVNDHKLTKKQCAEIFSIAQYINNMDESKAIDQQAMPKIIISASGMITGGRILHHLKIFGPNPKNTIILAGFQTSGTRGARLLAGENELIIHGQTIPIRARVEYISNTSAHADYEEILSWLQKFTVTPKKVFITHGEPDASEALKNHIESSLGWQCYIPKYREAITLV